ncbi:integrase [Streptomyces triticirhizae]|uniref:Integrase n=1 Tax=Streptomyces triticirhizae TaxID=2483353 RepID=A0A3M2LM85_9ACTN|nr:integrase [Streptomyces triticirhizae]
MVDWAGNSVPALLSTYARCLDGQRKDPRRRIEAAQDLTGRAVPRSHRRKTWTRI